MDSYLTYPEDDLPKTLFGYYSLNVPLKADEHYVAFDANRKLWAYKFMPSFSEAAQKWIPVDEDTPRLILQLSNGQVNSKNSIRSL